MNVLIVYYSRTGTIRRLAEVMKNSLSGDTDEIQDVTNRSGVIGWLKAGKDTISKSLTRIEDVDLNPSDYKVVVIGSPTWNGTISTPIRTYIAEYQENLCNVALFSTGFSDKPVAVDEMEMLIGCKSIAKLHLLQKQVVENGEYQSKVDDFTKKIKNFLDVHS